ncbi:MAG: glycerate kinase [Leptolyngbyaceae cyanobacterium RU_5_1]|nr:glycerate kinase [Leptolyngbyaceae cyanobacterium RU_5_1]
MLSRLVVGEALEPVKWQQLEAQMLADVERAKAFGVTVENVSQTVRQQAVLLQEIYPAFTQLCDRLFTDKTDHLETLWTVWLPLARHLVEQRQAVGRPFVQGILGGQGTGKTTLSAVLTLILQHLGYRTLSWSLDDLYKTYRDRLLLQQQDPRLIWRGPPGTHDVDLGMQVLDQLRQPIPGQSVHIPRFDKSLHNGAGDRVALPEEHRVTPETVENIDIVLFEGWFIGARPIDPIAFDNPPPPITSDADRTFAQDMNTRLQDYLPLWKRLDSVIVLYVPDYQLSKQWRKQAEHQMIATGKPGMTDAEIDAFVEYFWKALHPELFITPLIQTADLVIEIQPNHTPGRVRSSL